MIGHFDWRVENLAFRDADIVAIYDWDSVAAAPEAVVVGNAAAKFTADWTSGEFDPLPSVAEMQSFVGDYERAEAPGSTVPSARCSTRRISSPAPTGRAANIPT